MVVVSQLAYVAHAKIHILDLDTQKSLPGIIIAGSPLFPPLQNASLQATELIIFSELLFSFEIFSMNLPFLLVLFSTLRSVTKKCLI